MLDAVKTWIAEPAPAPVPPRGRTDIVLALVVAVVMVSEIGVRTDLLWREPTLLIALILGGAMLARRTHPMACFLFAFAHTFALHGAAYFLDVKWIAPHSHGFVLIFSYALFRWGRGRDAAIGVVVLLAVWAGTALRHEVQNLSEAVAAFVLLALPAAFGTLFRFRAARRATDIENAKQRERERIARDLHDSVAHHVSAIVITAQAGLYAHNSDEEAAPRALRLIADAASETLADMRRVVGVLRDDKGPPLSPQATFEELDALATQGSGGVPVAVRRDGVSPEMSPTLSAALFRIAQEAVTNARRHAQGATHIDVHVERRPGVIALDVTDNGTVSSSSPDVAGFGLVGMAERATLLGGTFQAGPQQEGGWKVQVTLPMEQPAT